jgi:hypothetical protein
MPTQAARVATWVPTIVAGTVGSAILSTTAPAGAQAPIATQFGTVPVTYATAVENQNGTLTGRSLDPIGLRTELVRLLGIPTGTMQVGDVVATSTAEAGMLVKTLPSGLISQSLIPAVPSVMPDVIDAGTF